MGPTRAPRRSSSTPPAARSRPETASRELEPSTSTSRSRVERCTDLSPVPAKFAARRPRLTPKRRRRRRRAEPRGGSSTTAVSSTLSRPLAAGGGPMPTRRPPCIDCSLTSLNEATPIKDLASKKKKGGKKKKKKKKKKS